MKKTKQTSSNQNVVVTTEAELRAKLKSKTYQVLELKGPRGQIYLWRDENRVRGQILGNNGSIENYGAARAEETLKWAMERWPKIRALPTSVETKDDLRTFLPVYDVLVSEPWGKIYLWHESKNVHGQFCNASGDLIEDSIFPSVPAATAWALAVWAMRKSEPVPKLREWTTQGGPLHYSVMPARAPVPRPSNVPILYRQIKAGEITIKPGLRGATGDHKLKRFEWKCPNCKVQVYGTELDDSVDSITKDAVCVYCRVRAGEVVWDKTVAGRTREFRLGARNNL